MLGNLINIIQVTLPSVPNIGQNPFILIAKGTNIDGNTLAATTLTYQSNFNASNTLPLFAKITRKSGTVLLLVFTIRLNSNILASCAAIFTALLGSGGDFLTTSLTNNIGATVTSVSSNYDVNVTTINGSAATFDLEIYGIKL